MKKKLYNSRRKTPWDNKAELTATERFIKQKYEENFKSKHPRLSETNEDEIINSIQVTQCTYCNSTNIKRYGKTNNRIKRYYCKECKKTFTPITNTIFDNHKISLTEWIEFLLDIFNYGSTTLTSKVNKNGITTSTYWLHKIFLLIEDYQREIMLKGNVYIDEFFYKVIKSDVKTKGGKELRGISQNQYCIGIGYDGHNVIAIVEGFGKPSIETTRTTFMKHIEPNSKLIHDDEKSHKALVKELNLTDESYSSYALKQFSDDENPMKPLNHQCDLLRQFLNMHSGFNRKDLQNYLNLFCFMSSGHKNKLEKVNELLILALTKKISLTYREFYMLGDTVDNE